MEKTCLFNLVEETRGWKRRADQIRGIRGKPQSSWRPLKKGEKEHFAVNMIVKVDLVLLAAPWHCEIWRAAKDSFKNRTNYVNYRTIFQFRMMCRACVWQRARRSHWGLQRQRRGLLWTTAGWMFCMSNKRDFHNISRTMLRDLSAQDRVLREEGRFRGGGAAGEPLGIFLLGTAWSLSPDWEQHPGAGGLSGLATGCSHVQSVHIRISQEGRETKAGRRLWQRPSGALW